MKPTNQPNRFHNQPAFPTNKPTNQLTNKTVLKTILLFFLSSFLFLPSAVYAFDFDGSLKGVTITDTSRTNAPPSAVITHTVVSEDPLSVYFDASGSSDPDGSIAEYRWDFGDGTTGTGSVVTHTYQNDGKYSTTLTVVDSDGGVSLSQVLVENTLQIFINFQPTWAEVPDGFHPDGGDLYGESVGYGWQVLPSGSGVDRNNVDSPDQSYDTFHYAGPLTKWEIKVPNGSYTVIVCAGDPSFPKGNQNVQAEGVSIVEDVVISADLKWIEKERIVNVNDARLTLTFLNSSPSTRICWVKVAVVPIK